MCGIAGAFQQSDGKTVVGALTDLLEHRGPDASGMTELVSPTVSVVLGHRRLSILDPRSAADQPMTRGGLTVVYNGELYNFAALRTTLEGLGSRFSTAGDTEVVVEAWRHWGTDCLAKFRGMFAMAVFDESDATVTVARDPMGIKPLYLMPRGDGVVFASELKALVGALGEELTIDPAAMVASSLYYWVPPQTSSIRGVRQLNSGTWQTWYADGRTRAGSFWQPAQAAALAASQPQPDLARVVEESVLAHLVSDAPVASFLSGGLDSSLITAIAHHHDPSIEAWTIGFRAQDQRLEAMPDDARFARRLAGRLGLRLHEIELRPDVTDLLPRMVATVDEPIGDPAAINTYLMCRAAGESGVKVLLSGMGADELFGGYRKHLACLLATRYQRLPRRLRGGLAASAQRIRVHHRGAGRRTVRWGHRFLSFAELPAEAAFRRSYTLYDPDELSGLLDPQLGPLVTDTVEQHRAVFEDNTFDHDPVNRMCLTDVRMFMQGLNLTYTDRASMAASTEVRVPFVDTEVFAAAFALPGAAKIRGRRQKVPLKQVARDWLPDDIINRPKASFGAPLRAWVTHDLAAQINDLLVDGELTGSGFLAPDAVTTLIADQRSGRRDTSKQVWQLLTLELWYRTMRSHGVSAP